MPHPCSAACSGRNRRHFRHAIGGARNNIIQGSYAIDSTKLRTQLGWHPATPFEQGIEKTVRWYLSHQD